MSSTIVVVGGSAGSVYPLISLLSALPRDFPAVVLITLHLPPQARSFWPGILSRATGLRVVHPCDGQRFSNETVCLGPPDRHLLVGNDCVTLGAGPLEHHNRPAVDAMFRSASISHRERVIGVVLSGRHHDGASGLAAISARGGTAVVQSPFDARERSMPESALVAVEVNHCVAAQEIGALLERLVTTPRTVPTYEGAA